MASIKFSTGLKSEIDNGIASGRVTGSNLILTSDTDELVFINPQAEKRVLKSKTQNEYVLKGTNLGGLEEGDVISAGTSIDELLKMITQKVVHPNYEMPVISLGSNLLEQDFEVGSSIDIQLQSQFIQNDAGAVTSHNIYCNDNLIYEGNSANISTENNNFIIPEGRTIFYSQASYEDGEIKNNNFDEPDTQGMILADSLTSESMKINGYRKLFCGSGEEEIPELTSEMIRNLSTTILNPQENLVFSFDMEAGQQYVIIAYPSYLGKLKEIKYVQIGDTEMASNFEQFLVNVKGANDYQETEYKVYTYKTASPIASKMTFQVTI